MRITLAPGDGTTNDRDRIRAALSHGEAGEIELLPGRYATDGALDLPSGKSLHGEGATVHALWPFGVDDRNAANPAWNRVLRTPYDADGCGVFGLTIDGGKHGGAPPGGPDERLTLFGLSGRNGLAEDCAAYDGTGYANFIRGEFGQPAGWTLRRCTAWNCDTLFETTRADGVRLEQCHGHGGDGDIKTEAAFALWSDSNNVHAVDCSYVNLGGNARLGLLVETVAGGAAMRNIVLERFRCLVATGTAAQISGVHQAEVALIDSEIVSQFGFAADLGKCLVRATRTLFAGRSLAINVGGLVDLRGRDSRAIGRIANDSVANVYGILSHTGDSAISWQGGALEAYGNAARYPYTGFTAGTTWDIGDDVRMVPA